MKYESELIKEIVDTRGHDKSSLHYQSECIETWIEEAKGAYPKLTDYRSEWLNYIAENPIGVFPYITLSDVTEATIENVVPYAYKSAILTGNTFVNLVSQYENSNGVLKATINGTFETNKKYIIRIYNNPFNVKSRQIVVKDATYHYTYFEENRVFINDMNRNYNQVYVELTKSDDTVPTVDEIAQIKVLVLEYQDGMENWDIPYFTGMQSVKMPVLKTSNINQWDGKKISDLETDYIEIYNCQFSTNAYDGSVTEYDENFNVVTNKYLVGLSNKMVTTKSNNCKYIRIESNLFKVTDQFYVEGGLVVSSFVTIPIGMKYEPHKSNILTVNEDVELRGIGDVQDTLDCLTGEVTERIVEVVFDGSVDEGWSQFGNTTTQEKTCLFSFFGGLPTAPKEDLKMLSDKYIIKNDFGVLLNTDEEMVHAYSDQAVYFRILKSKLSTQNVTGFKEWLSQNPFTIQYQLKTESVKTVDLNIQDQDGNTLTKLRPIEGTMHLSTSGTLIKPTFSGEIPVEATTQNLASFIEE